MIRYDMINGCAVFHRLRYIRAHITHSSCLYGHYNIIADDRTPFVQ